MSLQTVGEPALIIVRQDTLSRRHQKRLPPVLAMEVELPKTAPDSCRGATTDH